MGSGFDAFSVVRWNGAGRSTQVISTTQITASIPSTDLATAASADVAVFNPGPGGGFSTVATFMIDPPPTLTISAATVAAGGSETVTLHDGFGSNLDWLALAATSDAHVDRQHAGHARHVSVPPVSERRLRTRRHEPECHGDAGTADDHLALADGGRRWQRTDHAHRSSRPRRYGGTAPIDRRPSSARPSCARRFSAGDLAAVGTAQITAFTPPPGGGLSAASQAFTIKPPPALTVSTTSATGGAQVTVTLANGFGESSDWLALAAVGAADTSYLQWTYVGAGVTTRTWTVTMPAAGGAFEFRLFVSGYTRAATSPTVTAGAGSGPALTVSATSVNAGAPVTVTLTNGAGGDERGQHHLRPVDLRRFRRHDADMDR